MYSAPHVRPKSPYVVGVELFYSYANLVMNMMRVHDQGFVDHIDHQHAMHSHVPAALQADLPLLTFPVNLFRWGWIVFQARQKRRYNWWCARCGPYPNLVVDVCHGINALRRTTTHAPAEVCWFRSLSSLSLPSGDLVLEGCTLRDGAYLTCATITLACFYKAVACQFPSPSFSHPLSL